MPGNDDTGFVSDKKLSDLCRVYADVLSRQGNASSAYSLWSESTRRGNEFVWLEHSAGTEVLLSKEGASLVYRPGDPSFEQVHQMFGTCELNPYERELNYGYPYVIGRVGTKKIRGPLLSMVVHIEGDGNKLIVRAGDGPIRFNLLPFRQEGDSDAVQDALRRVIDATPAFPLSSATLNAFVDVLRREVPGLQVDAELDGRLGDQPVAAASRSGLKLIDAAALFIAPRTNWFLRQDLEDMAEIPDLSSDALQSLIHGAGDGDQVAFTPEQVDAARVVFPFPSNRAQRKVALLLEDETTNVVRVEGPPGTGKSLTIANLACHLAASGKRVLITSQKDKALEVVDQKLQELDLPEIPMTLLRQDLGSKSDLVTRLDRVKKDRSAQEVGTHLSSIDARFGSESADLRADLDEYINALGWESEVERSDREYRESRGLSRVLRRFKARQIGRKANRLAPRATDELAEEMKEKRGALLDLSVLLLQIGLENEFSQAKRHERNSVRQLQQMLKRNQKSYKNFSMFERQKQQHDQALALLQVLPVWIMAPDDVARMFPCVPNLFDVVIVDEASQVDLPSITPLLYRAKKVAVFGDSKQMQSRRFAFQSSSVATQAWQHFKMEQHDPEEWLHPVKSSLLSLAGMHAEEECLLDEHFRSLPPIIDFSNHRWYQDRLRVMTDVQRKRFGGPGQTVVQMHHLDDGRVRTGTQENLREAEAVLQLLRNMVISPDYANASIGVLCLFDDQVELVKELVTKEIDPAEWDEHSIAIVNPDGFQGDERDVILYSFSWDDDQMPRAALSARQQDSQHIQGMLNVAFTRAKDEIHVFHSAPIDTFGLVGGSSATIADWLKHCQAVEDGREVKETPRAGHVDSEFEAQVADALRFRGVEVTHQYPSCGFFIDIVCEKDGNRVAVECDGEIYHRDEHGNLRIEDVERQAILERAGWTVLRIPYRKWQQDPDHQLDRVMAYLNGELGASAEAAAEVPDSDLPELERIAEPVQVSVTKSQRLIVEAIRSGSNSEEDVFRYARIGLGHSRLGSKIRQGLVTNARSLQSMGLIHSEEGEYFLTPEGRSAVLRQKADPPRAKARTRAKPTRGGSRRRY